MTSADKSLRMLPKEASDLDDYRLLYRLANTPIAELFVACRRPYFGNTGGISDELIVLKLYHRSICASYPGFVASVEWSHQHQRAIQHPNIVQVIETGWIDGRYFVISEYVDGESLAALRARHTLSPMQTAMVIANTAEALRAGPFTLGSCDMAALPHGHLSASNILIRQNGTVVISDFRAYCDTPITMADHHHDRLCLCCLIHDQRFDPSIRDILSLLWLLSVSCRPQQEHQSVVRSITHIERSLSVDKVPRFDRILSYPTPLRATVTNTIKHLLHDPVEALDCLVDGLREALSSSRAEANRQALGSLVCRVFADRFEAKRQLVNANDSGQKMAVPDLQRPDYMPSSRPLAPPDPSTYAQSLRQLWLAGTSFFLAVGLVFGIFLFRITSATMTSTSASVSHAEK